MRFGSLASARASARLLLFQGDRLALNGGELFWPAEAAGKWLARGAAPVPLGADCFAAEIGKDAKLETRSLRSLLFGADEGGGESGADLALVSRASQLLHWRRTHRCCGLCGSPTRPGESGQVLECVACGQAFFPRINPCVIMLVTRGDEVLLARGARYRSGYYSCLAGFIEIGETPEQTIIREVREEVGVEIGNIRYVESQPWPFPSQLMLGFLADHRAGEIVPDPAEIEDARWFPINDLPKTPAASVTIAGKLIDGYVRSRSSAPL